ncbi:NAD(P)/FAD-dependent oxidoreductase [Streptomyces luteolifulvus]|jgi:sulfide:quinone oxidoreductase|uniref:NAD(P)/FAD-dependent oxidoreductase n=1 Tax=Streptomyces luteolifulvus TaxID=2615112 RepID=A0A6H9V6Z5_9ACTN|nr:FAD/NAD(P)-binding oxidoreductase [Streptomyces luteolifulvus]KAB1149917.1 NAD(P)/FAD-dependent oxidoreductase [Streptomyces luteolifulvus]
MGKHIVILGGGTAGTMTANRLRRTYDRHECRITVVDQDDDHLYQPGLLFVPFGLAQPHHLVRSRPRQLDAAVDYKQARIERVDLDARVVHLAGGIRLTYDVLVVATGATLLPEETEGLTGPGWGEKVFTFYDLPGAVYLHHALERFDGGRVVIDVADLPVKCPVAPLEFAFLADWYFQRCGIRDKVHLTYVTPLDGAFTKPVAAKALGGLLKDKGVELVTEFTLGEVDGVGGRLVSYDEREVPFDLAVVVPLHGGAEYVGRSEGLGDELGFVPVDPHSLQHPDRPEVFAIGDAAGLSASKAGSVAHFEGEVLVHNIGRFLDGKPLDASFDGHANCFVETGFHKALLIDFNYATEPLPGHFPTAVGLPLLKESHANHLGKLAFEWLYWHSLLPGRGLPGIGSAMPEHGKHHVSD